MSGIVKTVSSWVSNPTNIIKDAANVGAGFLTGGPTGAIKNAVMGSGSWSNVLQNAAGSGLLGTGAQNFVNQYGQYIPGNMGMQPNYGGGQAAGQAGGNGYAANGAGGVGGSGQIDPNQVKAALRDAGMFDPTDYGLLDQIKGYSTTLGTAGNNFLSSGSSLPWLKDMGALGNVEGSVNDLANMVGVTSPFDTTGGTGAPTSPYALYGPQQEEYTNQADAINQSRDKALSRLRAQYAAAGITDPRAMSAAEAHINTEHDALQNQAHSTLANQAFGTRLNTLQSFPTMLLSLYGAQNARQMGMTQMGAGLTGNAAGEFGNVASIAQRGREQALTSAGSMAGLYQSRRNPPWISNAGGATAGGQASGPFGYGAISAGNGGTQPWMTPGINGASGGGLPGAQNYGVGYYQDMPDSVPIWQQNNLGAGSSVNLPWQTDTNNNLSVFQ